MRRYAEIWGDMRSYAEIWGGMRSYAEVWGGMRRHAEIWGGMRRYTEICGQQLDRLPPVRASSLRDTSVYLPISPHISAYLLRDTSATRPRRTGSPLAAPFSLAHGGLPTSVHISPYLPISPHISAYLPTIAPHISAYLSRAHGALVSGGAPESSRSASHTHTIALASPDA